MPTDVAAALRDLRGHQVRLVLRSEPAELEGRLRGVLESDDGLVAYVVDGSGTLHTVHYHQVVAFTDRGA